MKIAIASTNPLTVTRTIQVVLQGCAPQGQWRFPWSSGDARRIVAELEVGFG